MDVQSKVSNTKSASQFRVVTVKGEDVHVSLCHDKEMILQFVNLGEGEYFVNGRKMSFCRNSLLISRPNDVHFCIPSSGSLVEKACYAFPLHVVDGFLPHSFYRDLPSVLQLSEQEATRIRIMIQKINDEINCAQALWLEKVMCETKSLLMMLSQCTQHKSDNASQHPLLRNALDYIEKNYRANITIQSLSKQVNISGSRLSHVFRKEVGMGIKQYVIQRRIAEAKRQLTGKHHPKMDAIAAELGFLSARLFFRHFKQVTGMTPSGYLRSVASER